MRFDFHTALNLPTLARILMKRFPSPPGLFVNTKLYTIMKNGKRFQN